MDLEEIVDDEIIQDEVIDEEIVEEGLPEEEAAEPIGSALTSEDVLFFRESLTSLNNTSLFICVIFVVYLFVYLGHSLRTLFSRIGG